MVDFGDGPGENRHEPSDELTSLHARLISGNRDRQTMNLRLAQKIR